MRMQILNRISDLEDEHCKTCETAKHLSSSSGERQRFYLYECPIGGELTELGEKLLKPNNRSKARSAYELSEKGVPGKVIAEKLGLKLSTTYRYISEVRQAEKENSGVNKVVKKVEETVKDTKEVINLKKKVEELEIEITRWEDLSKRHKEDYSKQSEDKAKLATNLRELEVFARKLETELDATKAEHIEVMNENAKLKEELAQSKKPLAEPAYELEEQVDRLFVSLRTEQEKSRHLLSYLILDNS